MEEKIKISLLVLILKVLIIIANAIMLDASGLGVPLEWRGSMMTMMQEYENDAKDYLKKIGVQNRDGS